MNEVLLIGGMAVVTFLTRYPMLALAGKAEVPRRVFDALRYVAPSVLAAMVLPAVLLPDNHPIRHPGDAIPLAVTVLAVVVMWRTKNLLATVIVGIAAFLVLRALLLVAT